MSRSDDDEIAKSLREKGATRCPPKAARELGETSRGWRREAEADRSQSERAQKRQQKRLRERGGFTGEKKRPD